MGRNYLVAALMGLGLAACEIKTTSWEIDDGCRESATYTRLPWSNMYIAVMDVQFDDRGKPICQAP